MGRPLWTTSSIDIERNPQPAAHQPRLGRSHALLRRLRNNCAFLRVQRKARILVCLVLVYLAWLYWSPSSSLKAWRALLRLDQASIPSFTPKVSREVFDRLSNLEKSLLNEEELAQLQPNAASNPDVPIVTQLPDARPGPISPDLELEMPDNDQICPALAALGQPCAFVLAGFIGEQETKAQIHLHQLGLLALRLNRTLVLPQVARSRMGTCLAYPFELYYDSNALETLGVRTITHAQFTSWSATRSPSARLVSLVDSKQKSTNTLSAIIGYDTSQPEDVLPLKPGRNFCVNSRVKGKIFLNFTSFHPLLITAPVRWHSSEKARDNFARETLSWLSKDSFQQNDPSPSSEAKSYPDVLVFNYEIRYPLLDPTSKEFDSVQRSPEVSNQVAGSSLRPFEHFPYASVWVDLVGSIINHLPPFVAVHWRQETISIPQLEHCAKSLVKILGSLKKSYPSLEAVYLSSDYPVGILSDLARGKQAKSHSGTFSKLIRAEHHVIMTGLLKTKVGLEWATFDGAVEGVDIPERLVDRLSKLPNIINLVRAQRMVPGSGGAKENHMAVQEAMRQLDSGLIGIMEKMILMKSNAFLTGLPNECSRRSSFTEQIIQERDRLIDERGGMDSDYSIFEPISLQAKKDQVLNLVEYWGI